MPLIARETREESNIGNQETETKSETEMEISFRYVREQLEIKEKRLNGFINCLTNRNSYC